MLYSKFEIVFRQYYYEPLALVSNYIPLGFAFYGLGIKGSHWHYYYLLLLFIIIINLICSVFLKIYYNMTLYFYLFY